jgi:hypothetical protein
MKTSIQILFIAFALILFSCEDSMEEPLTPDDNTSVALPVEVLKTGSLTAQSSTNTVGMVSLVKDKENKYFVRLSESFTTKFSTGTVTVYLSTGQNLTLNSPGSFQLVSIVGKPGEQFFALPALPDAKFTHSIIWCGAAAIPFGFAPLN